VNSEPEQVGHGGKREGAGRKPAPAGTQKVPYSTRLAPLVVEYLKSRANATGAIERAVTGSKAFRAWKRDREPQPMA